MNKLKRAGLYFLTTAMLLSSVNVMAKEGQEAINISYNNTKVYVENKQVTVATEPFMYDGKTYIEASDIAKMFGYTVVNDASGQTVGFTKDQTTAVGLTKEVEGNNTYSTANLLQLNATLNGTLGAVNSNNKNDEYDYFKINVLAPSNVQIELTADADFGVSLYIYAQDGAKIIKSDYGTNKKINVDVALEGGEYYIRVARKSHRKGNYTLKTKLIPQTVSNDTPDNSSYQHAQVYTFGETATGLLGFVSEAGKADEYDWYVVDVAEESEVSINLTASQDLGASLYIYGEDAAKVIASTYGRNKKLKLNKRLDKGTYYIRVARSGGGKGNGSYTLTSK